MKKTLILILLWSAILFCKEVKFNDLVKRDELWYEKNSNTPFTGMAESNAAVADIIYKTFYKDGIIYKSNVHTMDNFLLREVEMNGEIPNGLVKRYDPQQKTYYEQIYKDGVLYDITTDKPYEGPLTEYYPDGQVRIENYFKGGKNEGTVKFYFQNGALYYEINYSKGKHNGHGKQFYRNGNIAYECDFIDGVKNGSETTYYENGRLKQDTNWKDGKKEGPVYTYYGSGKKEWEYIFVNGLIQGNASAYYENGKLRIEGNFVDSKKEGIWKSYYENGELKSEMPYKNGLIDGTGIEYFPEEKKLRRELWEQGKRVKVFPLESSIIPQKAANQLPWLKAKQNEAVNKK
ncbi:MAG: toxin-antitoxin system YwqK family antitoxin [Fusobacteriaceae bacterium]|nr:toxin-antitoxin system YwqK family antitoxin [Fusobacteriaceae bacterium]